MGEYTLIKVIIYVITFGILLVQKRLLRFEHKFNYIFMLNPFCTACLKPKIGNHHHSLKRRRKILGIIHIIDASSQQSCVSSSLFLICSYDFKCIHPVYRYSKSKTAMIQVQSGDIEIIVKSWATPNFNQHTGCLFTYSSNLLISSYCESSFPNSTLRSYIIKI